MKKIIWRNLLIVIVGLVAGYYIYNHEAFQEAVFPKEYWTEKVKELEYMVQSGEVDIRDALIELEKIERTKDLVIEQEINNAKLFGDDINEARKDAVESVREEIQDLQEMLQISRELLYKKKQLLEKAKQKLVKYNNK